MTNDLDDEAKAISMITVLVGCREDAGAARIGEEMAKKVLLPFLRALPEGERELWDQEQSPPVGVALKDRASTRIIEWAAVPDEAVLWAKEMGLLKGADMALYDALAQAMSQSTQHHIAAIREHIIQGTTETLVSLPERGRR